MAMHKTSNNHHQSATSSLTRGEPHLSANSGVRGKINGNHRAHSPAYSDSFVDSDEGPGHSDDEIMYSTEPSDPPRGPLKQTNGRKPMGSQISRRPGNSYLPPGGRHRGGVHARGGGRAGRLSPSQLEEATRQVLTASEVKLKDMRSENDLLKKQIQELTKEMKTMERQNKLQVKQIDKATNRDAEVPSLVARYNSELHALQEQLRRQKEKTDVITRQNKDLDLDLTKARRHITKLKDLVENQQLGERDALAKQIIALEDRLMNEEKARMDVEKNLEIIQKNHRHELNIEIARSKELKARIREKDAEINNLTQSLKEKIKMLEMQNIYSQRMVRAPHRLQFADHLHDQALSLPPVSAPSSISGTTSTNGKSAEKRSGPKESKENGLRQKKRVSSLDRIPRNYQAPSLEKEEDDNRDTPVADVKVIHGDKTEPAKSTKNPQVQYCLSISDTNRLLNMKNTSGNDSTSNINNQDSTSSFKSTDLEDNIWAETEEASRRNKTLISQETQEKKEREEEEEKRRREKELEEQRSSRMKAMERITAQQRQQELEERKRKDDLIAKLKALDIGDSSTTTTSKPNNTKSIKPASEEKTDSAFPWEFSTYQPTVESSKKPPVKKSIHPPATQITRKNSSDMESDLDEIPSINPSSDSTTKANSHPVVHQGHPGLMATSNRRGSYGNVSSDGDTTPLETNTNNNAKLTMKRPGGVGGVVKVTNPAAITSSGGTRRHFNDYDDDDDVEIEQLND